MTMIDVSAEIEKCRVKVQRTYRIAFYIYSVLFAAAAVGSVAVGIWYYAMFVGLPCAWVSGWVFNHATRTR